MHAFRSSHATRGVYHRLVWREEGGARLRFEYDTEDRLTAVVNEAGERYTFTLNALGQVQSETGFDGFTRKYVRDAEGRVVSADENAWGGGTGCR